MLDGVSLQIERLAMDCGSYIEATTEFARRLEFYEFEDLLETLHPKLVAKIRQEFIDKKYIPSMIQRNSLEKFF